MDKFLSRQQLKVIKDNAPKGADGATIIQGLVDRGYTLEGFNDKPKEQSLTDIVGADIDNRVNRVGEILNRSDTNLLEKGVQVFGQGAGLAANTLEQTALKIPGVKQVAEGFGAGVNWLATSELSPVKHLGDILGENNTLQEVTKLYDTDKNFKDTIDGVANIARLGGDVGAVVDSANYVRNVTDKIITKVRATGDIPPTDKTFGLSRNLIEPESPPPSGPNSTGVNKGIVSNIAGEVIPTADRIVNSEVTRALDLTQGDVKNISLSTGNDVGKFMADKNLIGSNLAETVTKLKDFFNQKYTAVRAEIGKIKTNYKTASVPRYIEALTEIKNKIKDVAGLQDANAEVDALLKKKTITLSDIQRAKELLDEHFSLYKATGDVKEGVAKAGLTNMRSDLRSFIEREVKNGTGADIRSLNNDVSTSRSIQDAIETRSTRGMTRANISTGDIMTFLTGTGLSGGNPLVGILSVLVKKIYNSATFKLSFSKWLDGLSDANKLQIKTELENGIVRPEIEAQISPLKSRPAVSNKPQTTLKANKKAPIKKTRK